MMNTHRVAAVMIGLSLVAVWAAASAGTRRGRVVAPRPVAAMSVVGPVAALPVAWIDGSVNPGRARPSISTHRRNLFRERVVSTRQPDHALATGSLETLVLERGVPPPPPLTLLGIAEQMEDGRLVRTAVLRGANDLWLAREGTSIGSRFRVERIGADHVEIHDAQTETALTLRFR
jgi:hypothetical protein